jgi:hypothetical protein
MFATLYLVSALLVGLLAIGQRGGFVVYFVIAIGVSPIIALLILILASPWDAGRRRRYEDADDPAYYDSPRRRSC